MEVGDECCLLFFCFFCWEHLIGRTIFFGVDLVDFRVFQPVFGLFLVVFFFLRFLNPRGIQTQIFISPFTGIPGSRSRWWAVDG